MQTSVKPSVFLICGHGIHCDCLNKYLQVSTLFQSPDFQNNYICPICQKTIIKADAYFASLDQWVAENPMPEEYQDWTRTIICNDCEKENVVKFNFFYHKVGERRERKLTWQCPNCSSYNTKPIQTFGRNKEVVEQVVCFVCFFNLVDWFVYSIFKVHEIARRARHFAVAWLRARSQGQFYLQELWKGFGKQRLFSRRKLP